MSDILVTEKWIDKVAEQAIIPEQIEVKQEAVLKPEVKQESVLKPEVKITQVIPEQVVKQEAVPEQAVKQEIKITQEQKVKDVVWNSTTSKSIIALALGLALAAIIGS